MMEEKPKATRSRRKRQPANPRFIDPDGMVVNECYCRKCKRNRHPKEFLEATDKFLDANGKMSVCNECIDTMYKKMLLSEKDMGKAILRMCRILNVIYVPRAIAATITHVEKAESKGKEQENVFGVYKSKVSSFSKINDNPDLTFQEPNRNEIVSEFANFEDEEWMEEMKFKWGESLTVEDYQFLEKEFANFKGTHVAETYSEIVLLKEVCHKLLDINKTRIERKTTATLVKELQELMKNLAISPNMVNQANSGKNMDTFGTWVKEIESFEPAEWWDSRREKYVDANNWGKFAKNHIVRTIQNTLGLTKNFTLADEKELEYDDDSFVSEEGGNAESE